MTCVIGFAGFSGSGKTTLISALVGHFAKTGLRTAVIKHDAHGHYKEAEASDSTQFWKEGAAVVAVVSPDGYILRRREAQTLDGVLETLGKERYDLIFVEGFKTGSHDKIAVFRQADQACIFDALTTAPVAAAAPSDLRDYVPGGIPFLDLNHIEAAAAWIQRRFGL